MADEQTEHEDVDRPDEAPPSVDYLSDRTYITRHMERTVWVSRCDGQPADEYVLKNSQPAKPKPTRISE